MAQRLEPEKDVDIGLRAWADSGLAGSGWRLTVAGDGSAAQGLRALARRLNIGDSVDFVGRQSHLAPLLARAGIFLATARAEPFGLSVVEAMASATPVVASASGAHLETVGACSSTWLFPVGDPLTCSKRLRDLTANAAERIRYGYTLQALQRKRFDLDSHVRSLAALYLDVMGW